MDGLQVITLEAGVGALNEIRQFVANCGQAAGLDAKALDGMVLAVDEAASNIIQHGYSGRTGWIEVEVESAGEGFVVRLRDRAKPFDPRSFPDPNLSLPLARRPIGKLGVFLMRKSVDQVRHRLLPEGGNELTLVKWFQS
ncbi:MAG TPA: ATP-binding protein [Anaerolineaceae bacterium]|nr:ATP-binding protein [Anaerolineaceae bacterium]